MLLKIISSTSFLVIASISYKFCNKIDFSQKAREEIHEPRAQIEDDTARVINSMLGALKKTKVN